MGLCHCRPVILYRDLEAALERGEVGVPCPLPTICIGYSYLGIFTSLRGADELDYDLTIRIEHTGQCYYLCNLVQCRIMGMIMIRGESRTYISTVCRWHHVVVDAFDESIWCAALWDPLWDLGQACGLWKSVDADVPASRTIHNSIESERAVEYIRYEMLMNTPGQP